MILTFCRNELSAYKYFEQTFFLRAKTKQVRVRIGRELKSSLTRGKSQIKVVADKSWFYNTNLIKGSFYF